MQVQTLSLANFRNFGRLELEFSPGVNLLHGDNGAGKTNLLEAVFLLCLGRSQRGAADQILLKRGEDIYRIEGHIERGDVINRVAVAFQKGGRKKLTVDQVAARTSDLYENYCAVSLGPEDSEILSGAPSVRRGFLDVHLSQFSRAYLGHLVDYHKSLAQKNACLKSEQNPSAFDELLVAHGSELTRARHHFIEELGRLANCHYSEISGDSRLDLTYQPSVLCNSAGMESDDVTKSFQAALVKHQEHERAVKTSLVGPHRDEIMIRISDYPARTHGSQGEWRTAAIALKLAVYELLKKKRRMQPVLLLDEIFAELDQRRSAALMRSFKDFGQLFVTTAVDLPRGLLQSGKSFRIHRGTVREII